MNQYYDRDKDNENAIKCYEACGFKRVEREETESYCCMGKVWSCIEMEISWERLKK